MALLETLAIHWCKLQFICAIGVIDTTAFNGANWRIGHPLASLMPMVSMVPLVTLAIHWYKGWFIGVIDAIGVNDANGTNDSSVVIDFNGQWRLCNMEDTSPFNGTIGANDATGANEAIGANVIDGIIFTIDAIVAIETIVAIGVIVKITTIVWPGKLQNFNFNQLQQILTSYSFNQKNINKKNVLWKNILQTKFEYRSQRPMYLHCLLWILIITIGANVATAAIGHHWCQQLSWNISTSTSPQHGANGAI